MLGLAVLLVAIGFASGFFSLNYWGYCFERGGRVSDQEKINAAVAELLGTQNAQKVDMPESGGGRQVIPYADVEDVLRLNPGCCTVGKEIQSEGTHRIDDLNRMFGFVSDFVTIKYALRYRDNQGIVHRKVIETHYVVDQCGNEISI
jgi:hypothetical protein